MLKLPPSQTFLLAICFLVTLAIVMLLINRSRVESQQPMPLPESTKEPIPAKQFLPATFGLPHIIGNVRILAVQVPANTECMGENEIRVVAQTDDQSEEALINNPETGSVMEYLKAWRPDGYISVMYVNTGITRDAVIANIQSDNMFSQENGCIKLGGIEISNEE